MRAQDIFAATLVGLSLGWGIVPAQAQEASAPAAATTSSAPAIAANKDKSKTKPAPPTADASDVDAPTPQAGAAAQTPATSAPSATSSTTEPQPTSATKAGDDNAFPEDVSKKAAQPAEAPAKKGSASDDNAFPEDISAKAAADAKAGAGEGAASDAASKSDSAEGEAAPGGDPAEGNTNLAKAPRVATVIEPDPKRAQDDIRVGKYYLSRRDYKGAYERFKDAATYDHENADAVFWLAEAGRKMNLEKEAAQNYEVYLEAVPDGPNSKAARKALGEMASATKP